MSRRREELLARWRAEEREQPEGWDFSSLDGRMSTDAPPWDLDAIWREGLASARHVLDMGTGGGEHLLRFRDAWPSDVVATEGWAPNLPVARKALEPHGVRVVDFGAPDHDPDAVAMPFDDARFDLVLNRHEAYAPREVARVLAPGGVLLTQQVGSGELPELHALLGEARSGEATSGEARSQDEPAVTYDRFVADAQAAGLVVTDGADFVGSYRFVDVAALVAYLQLVPWEVPEDFSVDRYSDALFALHDRAAGGEIALTMRRFWLRAQRPA